MPGCVGHKNCANCRVYALRWRERVLTRLASVRVQPSLWEVPA